MARTVPRSRYRCRRAPHRRGRATRRRPHGRCGCRARPTIPPPRSRHRRRRSCSGGRTPGRWAGRRAVRHGRQPTLRPKDSSRRRGCAHAHATYHRDRRARSGRSCVPSSTVTEQWSEAPGSFPGMAPVVRTPRERGRVAGDLGDAEPRAFGWPDRRFRPVGRWTAPGARARRVRRRRAGCVCPRPRVRPVLRRSAGPARRFLPRRRRGRVPRPWPRLADHHLAVPLAPRPRRGARRASTRRRTRSTARWGSSSPASGRCTRRGPASSSASRSGAARRRDAPPKSTSPRSRPVTRGWRGNLPGFFDRGAQLVGPTHLRGRGTTDLRRRRRRRRCRGLRAVHAALATAVRHRRDRCRGALADDPMSRTPCGGSSDRRLPSRPTARSSDRRSTRCPFVARAGSRHREGGGG